MPTRISRQLVEPENNPDVLVFHNPIKSTEKPIDNPQSDLYSKAPVSVRTMEILSRPRVLARKIPKAPFKTLDAQGMSDDYYLNPLDWSVKNVVAIALGDSTYLWDAAVKKPSYFSSSEFTIASVKWAPSVSSVANGREHY